MKKEIILSFFGFIFILLQILFFVKNHDTKAQNMKITDELSDNKIYFFSQRGCPHCNKALEFIAKNFNNINNFEILDINDNEKNNEKNFKLFIKCAEKFNLDKNSLGTPLICIGNKYFLGWNSEYEKDFKKYVNELFIIDR